MKFSIMIPTWNNLAFLKLCVRSIRQYSSVEHEILVHVNEGSDGTLEWVKSENIKHTHSEKNSGICMGLNQLGALATADWLVYLNDDMFCCPGWDNALIDVIQREKTDFLMLSSLVIEPSDTNNKRVILNDCGSTSDTFDERKLLASYKNEVCDDTLGVSYQPTIVSRRLWHLVGGYSIEFSPGMASDDDFLAKLWVAGCRHYQIVQASRVYHFGCSSTGRVRKNKGARQFNIKWGLTVGEMNRDYIAKTVDPIASQHLVLKPSRLGKFRRLMYSLSGIPLEDINAWEGSR